MGKYSKEAKPHTVLTIRFLSIEWKSRPSLPKVQKSSLEALVKETEFLLLGKPLMSFKTRLTLGTTWRAGARCHFERKSIV